MPGVNALRSLADGSRRPALSALGADRLSQKVSPRQREGVVGTPRPLPFVYVLLTSDIFQYSASVW